MKIDRTPTIPVARVETTQGTAAARTEAQASAPARSPQPDPVSRSAPATTSASSLLQARRRDEEVRAEGLKRIERDVRDGTYKPDLSLLAERILERGELLEAVDRDMDEFSSGVDQPDTT